MRRISASDAVFLDMETPNAPLIIGGMFILDPSTAPGSFVRHRDILEYVESRLHLMSNLRRKLVYHPLGLDEPRLIDDPDFDVEFHVRHIALPKPRDWRQLKIAVSRLISRPMDMHRPLWEMYIIEGLEEMDGVPPDAFAMLFKMHHATFDGKAGGAALWAFMQDTPDFEPLPPGKRWVPERKPDALGWTVNSLQEGAMQLLANLQAVPDIGKGMLASLQSGASEIRSDPREMLAPRTRFQNKITTHRVWDFARFEMADVRALRTALGKPKMNDLLLAVIGGGLRHYLAHHRELPEKPLLAFCPISVRGAGDPADGGNFVTFMRVTLGTDLVDPIERLKRIAENTKQGKTRADKIGGEFMGNMLALTPYPLRSRLMREVLGLAQRTDVGMPSVANTTITNAPNPPGGHYFTGAKVLSYAGFGPLLEGSGLFHTITGMDFEVTISVTSCREILPDIAFYVDCLRRSFAELQAAAGLAAPDSFATFAPPTGATPPQARAPAPARRRARKAPVSPALP